MENSNNLISIIRNETETLKNELIQQTITWANTSFNGIKSKYEKVKGLKFVDRYELLGVEITEDRKDIVDTISNKNKYYKAQKTLSNLFSIVDNGLEAYVQKAIKKANKHYEDSLIKLVSRIYRKGIVASNMKLVSGYVGINLEITLSDERNSVTAKTIWCAEDSNLVSPHYRYIIN